MRWLLVILLLTVFMPANAIVINEIMYHSHAEFGDEWGEWIELYNEENITVNLTGWMICDNELLPGYIEDFYSGIEPKYDRGMNLSPHSYALVTDGLDTDWRQMFIGTYVYGDYANLLNQTKINYNITSTLAFHINDTSLCGPDGYTDALEEEDLVYLTDNNYEIIDGVYYSAPAIGDYSIERIYPNSYLQNELFLDRVDMCIATYVLNNWYYTTQVFGTPGFKNTLSPNDYNLTLTHLNIDAQKLRPNMQVNISFEVMNSGYKSSNINVALSVNNKITYSSQQYFLPGEKRNYTILWTPNRGAQNITVSANMPSTNASDAMSISAVSSYNIKINEIMYDALGSDKGKEWLEVHNADEGCDSLEKWVFRSGGANHRLKLIQGNYTLCKEAYLIIADDADQFLEDYNNSLANKNVTLLDSAFSLKNTGELIELVDQSGFVVDSVTYPTGFACGDGKSLEYVAEGPNQGWNPSNKINGTPGEVNSAVLPSCEVSLSGLVVAPADPKPDMAVSITATVSNHGINTVNLTLYINWSCGALYENISLATDEVKDLIINASFVQNPSIVFANITSECDANLDNNNKLVTVEVYPRLRINEIMYHPAQGANYEWIELYNDASYEEDLTGWTIQVDTKPKNLHGVVGAHNYYILARDITAFESYYGKGMNVAKLTGSLKDSSDTVILAFNYGNDSYSQSVTYSDTMGGDGTGYSLESASTSWTESVRYGGTPGQQNNPDSQIKLISQSTKAAATASKTGAKLAAAAQKDSIAINILKIPQSIGAGEAFEAVMRVTNKQPKSISPYVYSYVLSNNKLISEGTKTANKIKYDFQPNSTEEIELSNKIKDNTESGTYTFVAAVKLGSQLYEAEKEIIIASSQQQIQIANIYLSDTNNTNNASIIIEVQNSGYKSDATLEFENQQRQFSIIENSTYAELFSIGVLSNDAVNYTAKLIINNKTVDSKSIMVSLPVATNAITGAFAGLPIQSNLKLAIVLFMLCLVIIIIALLVSSKNKD